MRFHHQFYKSASFYFALCFLCWPLAIVVLQPSNIFVNFFQLLFALFGLIMLIFTLFFDDGDTGDWIIAGRGRQLEFNRHFYRRGNFYAGLFIILIDLPLGTGLDRWENITFIVLGIIATVGSFIQHHD